MGKSESDACLYCKEIDTQVHALLHCPSTIQLWRNVKRWIRKDIQPHYKMCDWDKVFRNPKSSFIIIAIILNTKKVIYMNRQIGKEMHINLVKYHVYQQLKADEHKANINMTMLHFDERWNTVYDSLRHFGDGYWTIFLLLFLSLQVSAFVMPLFVIFFLL